MSTDEEEIVTPRRGEIWRVNFDPSLGSELRKSRPAVVLSSNYIGRLPIKLVAPITEWKDHFTGNVWHLRIEPNSNNGLTKVSAIDALQVRAVDTLRFGERLGEITAAMLHEILSALALVVEYP